MRSIEYDQQVDIQETASAAGRIIDKGGKFVEFPRIEEEVRELAGRAKVTTFIANIVAHDLKPIAIPKDSVTPPPQPQETTSEH